MSIGGDVSVAGEAPLGGWAVGIAHSSCASPHELEQVVAIESGAIATSSTTVRSWSRDGRIVHHIVDPATGHNADPMLESRLGRGFELCRGECGEHRGIRLGTVRIETPCSSRAPGEARVDHR